MLLILISPFLMWLQENFKLPIGLHDISTGQCCSRSIRHGEILYILCDSGVPSPHYKSQWGTFTPLGIWELWCQSGEVVDSQKGSCVLFSISRLSLPFKLGKLKSFFDRGSARPRTGFCFREVCYLSVPHVIHFQRSVVPAPSLGLCQSASSRQTRALLNW